MVEARTAEAVADLALAFALAALPLALVARSAFAIVDEGEIIWDRRRSLRGLFPVTNCGRRGWDGGGDWERLGEGLHVWQKEERRRVEGGEEEEEEEAASLIRS